MRSFRLFVVLKLFTAAGLWISLFRTRVRFSRTVQRTCLHAGSAVSRLSVSLGSTNRDFLSRSCHLCLPSFLFHVFSVFLWRLFSVSILFLCVSLQSDFLHLSCICLITSFTSPRVFPLITLTCVSPPLSSCTSSSSLVSSVFKSSLQLCFSDPTAPLVDIT